MRLVSLLITLLVLAFIIIQLLGSPGGNKAEQNSARMAEDKARTVEATILKSAQAQDRGLNATEGGNPDFNALHQAQGLQTAAGGQPDNDQQQSQ